MSPAPRRATRQRRTKETAIDVELALDGTGSVEVETGLPFFDHMLVAARPPRRARPDASRPPATSTSTPTTPWRTSGIVLGEALAEALGDKAGIRRFASIALPLDEALVEVALDLSGRPYLAYDVSVRARRGAARARRRSTRSWPRSSGGPSSPRRASRCTSAS